MLRWRSEVNFHGRNVVTWPKNRVLRSSSVSSRYNYVTRNPTLAFYFEKIPAKDPLR